MPDHAALNLARERLREFGIALQVESQNDMLVARHGDLGVDAIVTLSHADAKARYAVQVKNSMTLSALANQRSSTIPYPLLVVGDHISRRSAAALRDAGIQFVDALGNAFITFDGVIVEVQGRTEPINQARSNSSRIAQPRQPTNLFSRSRSQVIFALLAWPELVGGKVREIAQVAGTSVGQAHDALTRLEQAGFLTPTTRKLTRAGELLDFWTAAYPAGLGRRLEVAQYHGDVLRPISSDRSVYLSGESAKGVDIARPATLTVYVDAPDPKMAIANRWSTSPDRVPNIFLRHKFWVSPRPHEESPAPEPRNAPWPLVYADLLATRDPRLDKVARTWRELNARFDEI